MRQRKNRKQTKQNYAYNTLRVFIFFASLAFCGLGFARLTYAGEWLATVMSEEVLLTDPQKDKEIVEDFAYDMYVQPVAGAVLGCFELTLSFLTCCASCCEFRKLLRIVGTIFFVFSIIMVIFVMLAFKKLEKVAEIEETVGNVMLRNLNHLYNQVKEDTLVSRFTFEFNGLQVLLGCCGLFGYHDYENATLWKSGVGMNLTVPETCCKVNRHDFLLGGEVRTTHISMT